MLDGGGGGSLMPLHDLPLKKHTQLDPIVDKKARDKQRKREQAKRRKAMEKALLDENARRQAEANASKAWHRDTTRAEELQIKRFELDRVSPFEEHPASAGYVFAPLRFRALAADVVGFSPIFFQYSYAKGTMPTPFAERQGRDGGRDPPHPACLGYAMSRHDPAIISPIFLGMDFRKRAISLDEDDDDSDDIEDDGQRRVPAKKSPRTLLRERTELKRIMDARFANSTDCMVCESSQLPGCPGCWVASSDFYDRVHRVNHPNHILGHDNAPTLFETPSALASRSEAAFIQGLLVDIYAIRKHREKYVGMWCKHQQLFLGLATRFVGGERPLTDPSSCRVQSFVSIVIKSVPAGSVVSLRIDPTSTVKYLYDLYRSNYEHPDRKIYILLPTSQGLFWLDETITAASERLLAIQHGGITLEDFKIAATWQGPTDEAYMLVSVAMMHDEATPAMLAHYIRHNFVCHKDLHLTIWCGKNHHAREVPENVLDDPLQISMHNKSDVLIESALANRRMSREYEEIAMRRAIEKTHNDKMQSLLDARRNQKSKPRSKKEVRAYAYYHFATAEPRPLLRLAKLWQCFQKFDELKITKKGKLIDVRRLLSFRLWRNQTQRAAFTDDTAQLLSMHRNATVETFDLLIDRANHGVAPPVVANRDKFGMPLGTRLGLAVKDDREYAVELEIVLPDDVDVALDDAPAEGDEADTRRRKPPRFAVANAHREWKDMEWRKDVATTRFYSGADLLVRPFYGVRWDCFAQAYVSARAKLQLAKDHLDAYNRLAKPMQTEAVLKTKEIEKWKREMDALVDDMPPTGALTQACRRLQTKGGLLTSRAEKHARALKKARDDAANALRADEEALPPMSAAERLKHEFKLREGVLSPSLRNIAPDMDDVKERLGKVMLKGMGKAKYLGQQVKDNMEILKL
ncbi:Aste57867_22367 [Aphanomyces stellatus]|uniref:Aste57867_22367 protein n=1 Tax=Aphanomyces stellatus TaxID=120398 RepID=A0A485LL93_9STRA|nr:hypothetical protein As57867_022297 [Aphanomyces stellatus]VFT99030.1 Aste57867_22367 [Aphanomyces stellatus]